MKRQPLQSQPLQSAAASGDAAGNSISLPSLEPKPVMSDRTVPPLSSDAARILEESIVSVREALLGLRYGNVSLTVHEGRVVQIDVTEKKRLKPN